MSRLLAHPRPIIVLVGRTNVGKSTLFNRLTSSGSALVSETPGTTRDFLTSPLLWQEHHGTVVDTGGLGYPPDSTHYRRLHERTSRRDPYIKAIGEKVSSIVQRADHICLIVDAQSSITAEDERWAKWLLTLKKPVTIVVNKADNPKLRQESWDFYRLGIPEVHMVSALNGSGTGDLLDHLFANTRVPQRKKLAEPIESSAAIVLLGKPNVGKSTLFNALSGSPEAIVSPIAHTTREPSRRALTLGGMTMDLYDTVGLRKNLEAQYHLERTGALRTLKQLEHSQVAVLVLDPFDEEISHQDQELARRIVEARCAAVIAINKMDQFIEARREALEKSVRRFFPHLWYAPVCFVSAAKENGITNLAKTIMTVYENHKREFTTQELDDALAGLVLFAKDKKRQSSGVRLEQVHVAPPEFLIARFKQQKTPIAIIDLIEKRLREQLPLDGTPITIHVEKVMKPIPNRKRKV